MRTNLILVFLAAFLYCAPAHAIIAPEQPLNVEKAGLSAGPGEIDDIPEERTVTPEPSSLLLLAGGLLGMVVWMQKSKGL